MLGMLDLILLCKWLFLQKFLIFIRNYYKIFLYVCLFVRLYVLSWIFNCVAVAVDVAVAVVVAVVVAVAVAAATAIAANKTWIFKCLKFLRIIIIIFSYFY